ncbi:MAG: MBL fold metallo-hydrolase [bacterium]
MIAKLSKWRRRILLFVGAVTTLVVIAIGIGLVVAWRAIGTGPDEARAARMQASPQWHDSVFTNPQPLWNDISGSLTSMFDVSPVAVPDGPMDVVQDTERQLTMPAPALRVTWLGHSTTLIEIDGKRVLTDPIFGGSPFPIESLGPQRWYPPVVDLQTLRDVDVVTISHDHYDHLDEPTISKMKDWDVTFIVPLGVGAHLEYWGIPPERIVEMDWWDEHRVGNLRIVATPARHASGRQIFDQNRTLWAGYAFIGPTRRVMFSGDTGLFDEMSLIGERLGPFDVVMIEVGAYHAAWPDWHIGPEQAITGHKMLRGKVFMPIHWGLFSLAMHGWTEPIERVWVAANAAGVPFVAPRPGEVMDMDVPPQPQRWWPEVPWQTAQEAPIISTKGGDPNDRYAPSPRDP